MHEYTSRNKNVARFFISLVKMGEIYTARLCWRPAKWKK